MITAMQASRLRTANHLKTAADELSQAWGQDCLDEEDAQKIADVRAEVESIFARVIPNNRVRP